MSEGVNEYKETMCLDKGENLHIETHRVPKNLHKPNANSDHIKIQHEVGNWA